MYKNLQPMLTANKQTKVNSITQELKNAESALNKTTNEATQIAAEQNAASQKHPRYDEEPGSPNKKRSYRS